MLAKKIAQRYLKEAAGKQHLQCWCEGCAERLVELIVDDVAAEMKPMQDAAEQLNQVVVGLQTEKDELTAKVDELETKIANLKDNVSTAICEPGTTYLAGTPVCEVE
jgi:phage shock protein A